MVYVFSTEGSMNIIPDDHNITTDSESLPCLNQNWTVENVLKAPSSHHDTISLISWLSRSIEEDDNLIMNLYDEHGKGNNNKNNNHISVLTNEQNSPTEVPPPPHCRIFSLDRSLSCNERISVEGRQRRVSAAFAILNAIRDGCEEYIATSAPSSVVPHQQISSTFLLRHNSPQ